MQIPSGIQWVEWGPEAFRRAAAENKPILLTISAVWCHWCHVQDNTTYSDPEVVRLINKDYIAIRVDNDRRPDINRRYNMGGWPTIAFLTPEGDIITGTTYTAPDQMRTILRKVKQHYLRRSQNPANAAPWIQERQTPATAELSNAIVDDILGSVVMSFDGTYGGFGDEAKFPQTDALQLALAQYWYTRDEGLLTVVTKTLDHMASGGVYDQEEGGFFRYSTTRDWGTPHYEKMCEDNARLLMLYSDAHLVTGRETYGRVIHEIVKYVNKTLCDQDGGGFYGSQDADEEYYKLGKDRRVAAKAPSVDKTIYTNWNGLMISAYLKASLVLGDGSLREFAVKSIKRLVREAYSSQDSCMYHYLSEGTANIRGLLTDQVMFGEALLDAYQSTGDTKYVEYAQKLIQGIDKTLLDKEDGGYYDSPPTGESLRDIEQTAKPLDENSLASILLTKLHYITDDEVYLQKSRSILQRFAEEHREHGYMASIYALAVDLLLNQATRIVVVGRRTDRPTQQLHEASLRAYEPRKVILPLDTLADAERIIRLGYPADATPQARICFGKTCLPPITDPSNISRELSKLPGVHAPE